MGILEVYKGDITKVLADAIVNAANSSLLGGVVWTGLSIVPADLPYWKIAAGSWPAREVVKREKL